MERDFAKEEQCYERLVRLEKELNRCATKEDKQRKIKQCVKINDEFVDILNERRRQEREKANS